MTTHTATASVGLVPSTPGTRGPNLITRVLSAIADFFDSLAASQKAIHRYEYLVRSSDAELAVRGLKREDLSRCIYEQMCNRR